MVSKLAQRVASRYLERKGYANYPVAELKPGDTPDLDSWREKPVVPDHDHSELPGPSAPDEEEKTDLDGQTGKWVR